MFRAQTTLNTYQKLFNPSYELGAVCLGTTVLRYENDHFCAQSKYTSLMFDKCIFMVDKKMSSVIRFSLFSDGRYYHICFFSVFTTCNIHFPCHVVDDEPLYIIPCSMVDLTPLVEREK